MKISKKRFSIFVDFLLLALSAAYFISSFNIKDSASLNLSPAFYPRLLAGALFVMGLAATYIDIWGAGRTDKSQVNLGNIRKQLTIFISMIVFVVIWQELSLFYPPLFLLVAVLVLTYSDEAINKGNLAKVVLFTIFFTLFIYLVFDVAMAIEFI